MDLSLEVEIAAPAARVWEVLGERFLHVSEWAAPIASSCAVDDATRPAVGVTRACTVEAFGPFPPGQVEERLVAFDERARTFTYEAARGLPAFVGRAANTWTVEETGPASCRVTSRAVLELRGPLTVLQWPMACVLRRSGARVAEELKVFVEQGVPHARKRRAALARRA